MQKKDKVKNDQRTAKVCETELNNKVDFAYKVGLEELRNDSLSTDIYKVRVLQVIKEGSKDVSPLNEERTLLSHLHCRDPLGLKISKNYLIMGTSKDIYKEDQEQSYNYVLGERTWIEYWPTDAECQTEEHGRTCKDMEDMIQLYRVFGCPE